MIKNRIEKNLKKYQAWFEKNQIDAFRVYDRDIPEFPYIIDKYKNNIIVYDKTNHLDINKNKLPEVLLAIEELFDLPKEKIIVKLRDRQAGLAQYEKINNKNEFEIVKEGPCQFYINLYDYLDTGLFLDHRIMREKIYNTAKDKKILNLFCYTGSVSVFAAKGGAKTTSVDMSKTYLNWCIENFKLNKISIEDHQFIEDDALMWLKKNKALKYDIIFLDPPTFSNSKRMNSTFEVERDQVSVINDTFDLLNDGGILYFSNNKRDFKLNSLILDNYSVKDISISTIPKDFHDKKIHKTYIIQRKRP